MAADILHHVQYWKLSKMILLSMYCCFLQALVKVSLLRQYHTKTLCDGLRLASLVTVKKFRPEGLRHIPKPQSN